MNTRTPYQAWFDHTTRHFPTLAAAKQWIANHLGANNTTDDYGIQHFDPIDQTAIPDLLGADATPHPAPLPLSTESIHPAEPPPLKSAPPIIPIESHSSHPPHEPTVLIENTPALPPSPSMTSTMTTKF